MSAARRFAFPRDPRRCSTARQKAIEESIDTRRAHARRGRRAARRVPRAAEGGARAGRGDRRARARAARGPRARDARARRASAASSCSSRPSATSRPRRAARSTQIRDEVATLTILATEKVTRKTLTADDQRRLVEEALGELDFSVLGLGELAASDGGDRQPSTRARCSRPPAKRGASTSCASSSASSPTRSTRAATCRSSSSRPTSRRRRSATGSARMLSGADAADLELPRAA